LATPVFKKLELPYASVSNSPYNSWLMQRIITFTFQQFFSKDDSNGFNSVLSWSEAIFIMPTRYQYSLDCGSFDKNVNLSLRGFQQKIQCKFHDVGSLLYFWSLLENNKGERKQEYNTLFNRLKRVEEYLFGGLCSSQKRRRNSEMYLSGMESSGYLKLKRLKSSHSSTSRKLIIILDSTFCKRIECDLKW
jgi:hypothetical protein